MVYASKTNKIHILSETLYTGTCIHVVAQHWTSAVWRAADWPERVRYACVELVAGLYERLAEAAAVDAALNLLQRRVSGFDLLLC